MAIDMSTRRDLIGGALALAASSLLPSAALAQSTPAKPTAHFEAAWAELIAGRSLMPGRIALEVPRLAESGNSVGLKVTVDSPMTEADHVRRIHLLSEQNPIALIGRFHLSPRSGLAEVETSIRLATTQNVRAVAQMSDGTLRVASAEVVVLLAACLDPG